MGLTRYPNGVTVCSTTALQYSSSAGDGDLDCNRLFTAGAASIAGAVTIGGTLTVGTANPIVGQLVAIPVVFGTGSAAQVFSVGVPFSGNLIGAYVTIGSVSAIAAAYTVRIGSAGTVLVSSEVNTITNSYAQESLTIDSATVSSASGLSVTRGTQGTAGDSALLLVIQRTA